MFKKQNIFSNKLYLFKNLQKLVERQDRRKYERKGKKRQKERRNNRKRRKERYVYVLHNLMIMSTEF
jgi:hypothetical protein